MSDVINSVSPSVESPETYLQFGDRYLAANNLPLALKNYQRALAINPEFAAVHERIGSIYHQQGNFMEAIASFSKSVQIDPQSLESQLGLGNAYQQMGWSELAITHFQKALELHPDRFLAEYHCKLGDSLKERGRLTDAIASYERAISTNPDYVDGYRAIAQVHFQNNAPEAVNAIYERAENHNPELLQAKDYNTLGVAYLQEISSIGSDQASVKEELENKAIACFEKAIQIDPAYADAHCNLGSTFLRRDQLKDAILAYKEAIDIDPNFAQPYFNLGIVLNNIGKVDEAIACFQSAINLVPTWTEAHQYLSMLLSRKV
jgi:tetratricopeptide (TPR) repeat protein